MIDRESVKAGDRYHNVASHTQEISQISESTVIPPFP